MFKMKTTDKNSATIPICDLKVGDVAQMLETEEIIYCTEINGKNYHLILNEMSTYHKGFNFYCGATKSQVRLLNKDETITLEFYNE